ncbi:hypothetical protein F5Y05DRAFT_62145 [Hypoxylon sp. FL0543]|nr:hypothetical protein F5Y05DRAFT_62145 [Hypoxylon sp. FL0543]
MKAIFNPFAFIFPLWLAQPALGSLPKTGNITLFSDVHCKKPVYVNSFILGIGTCGKEDSAAPSPDPFHSFILNERPFCRSGARPYFSIYSDSTCSDLIAPNLPDFLVEEQGHHPCVAPGDFRGMAFVCNDLDGDEGSSSEASTSAEATVTEIAPPASETRVVTSTVLPKYSSISAAPSTPTTGSSSATSSSTLGSSVSGSTVTTTGPSRTASISPVSPVPTSGVVTTTTTDRALHVKLGLCLFFLVFSI